MFLLIVVLSISKSGQSCVSAVDDARKSLAIEILRDLKNKPSKICNVIVRVAVVLFIVCLKVLYS